MMSKQGADTPPKRCVFHTLRSLAVTDTLVSRAHAMFGYSVFICHLCKDVGMPTHAARNRCPKNSCLCRHTLPHTPKKNR